MGVTSAAERQKSRPDIKIYPDGNTLFAAAAERIAAELANALREKPTASLVLTGGNTPRPVYERLSTSLSERLDWTRIQFFWGDERCVPPDHRDSNFRMARETLLSKVSVPEAQIHRIPGELADPGRAALLYETEIFNFAKSDPVPRFDLVLLGMGADGHTASLFPEASWDEGRLVVASHILKLSAWRITMTPLLLNSARNVLFVTAGLEKAKALAGVLEGPPGTYPAQRIQPVGGTLTWMVDESAASLLTTAGIGQSAEHRGDR